MKKRVFSVFLIAALLLTALAGCAPGGESSSESPKEDEQLLETGYYEVYDEDDEFVGYLRVTSSKIVVYDEDGNEEDSLRYEYNEKKDLYTLDSGKLFGCEEFTVEKSRKKLKLITEDDDEYTLEETEKPKPKPVNSESPAPVDSADPAPGPSAATPYIRLPLGCYAVYNDGYLSFYLKVTKSTMISYYTDGDLDSEFYYSYNRDGICVIEADDGPSPAQITYERGSYYMRSESYSYFYRLEPVSESEIPVYNGGSSGSDSYYIGGNGSVYLYGWLPDALYGSLSRYEYGDGSFRAEAYGYDYSSGADMAFAALILSGDALQGAVEEVREDYYDAHSSGAELLYRSLRDEMVAGLDEGYIPDRYVGYMDYRLYEGDETINGRSWRYCEAYAEDAYAGLVLLLWMEGDNMAAVIISGIAEDSAGFNDLGGTLTSIIYSLELY